MKMLIYIGTGSFLGGVARYMLTRYVAAGIVGAVPYGTLAVNVLGCMLLGAIYELSNYYVDMPLEIKLMLAVGFCGGFTTFSTFMAENMAMLSMNKLLQCATYAAASLLLGFVAMWAGHRMVQWLICQKWI